MWLPLPPRAGMPTSPPRIKKAFDLKRYKLEAERVLREHPFVRAGMKEAHGHKIRNDIGKSGG